MGTYQRRDRLYRQAKEEGLRSRASYKLEELDKKHHLLRPGAAVLDLGCAPGGWVQVAARRVGPNGTVVGVDLEATPAFSEAELGKKAAAPRLITGDVRDSQVLDALVSYAPTGYDLVLSDMSPKLSGVRDRDLAAAVELVSTALETARHTLKAGGSFVAKIFPGPESDEVFKEVQRTFKKAQRVNLKSSRSTSNEFYFVAHGFLGK